MALCEFGQPANIDSFISDFQTSDNEARPQTSWVVAEPVPNKDPLLQKECQITFEHEGEEMIVTLPGGKLANRNFYKQLVEEMAKVKKDDGITLAVSRGAADELLWYFDPFDDDSPDLFMSDRDGLSDSQMRFGISEDRQNVVFMNGKHSNRSVPMNVFREALEQSVDAKACEVGENTVVAANDQIVEQGQTSEGIMNGQTSEPVTSAVQPAEFTPENGQQINLTENIKVVGAAVLGAVALRMFWGLSNSLANSREINSQRMKVAKAAAQLPLDQGTVILAQKAVNHFGGGNLSLHVGPREAKKIVNLAGAAQIYDSHGETEKASALWQKINGIMHK